MANFPKPPFSPIEHPIRPVTSSNAKAWGYNAFGIGDGPQKWTATGKFNSQLQCMESEQGVGSLEEITTTIMDPVDAKLFSKPISFISYICVSGEGAKYVDVATRPTTNNSNSANYQGWDGTKFSDGPAVEVDGYYWYRLESNYRPDDIYKPNGLKYKILKSFVFYAKTYRFKGNGPHPPFKLWAFRHDPTTIQENLALNKAAKQSSTSYSGIPQRATDGNIDGNFIGNSVTASAVGTNDPWWEVDLGAVYNISSIKIYNRTDDCCQERLKDFYVMVSDTEISSNSTSENVFAGPISEVKTIHELKKEDARGRYVRIFIPGSGKTLSLAEVEVFGTKGKTPEIVTEEENINIALNKAAYGSSNSTVGSSQKAVDGNKNGIWNNDVEKNSIALNSRNNPWWEVDLGAVYDISSIKIYNRTDNCCIGHIKGFYVIVSNSVILENSTTENLFAGPIIEVKSEYELTKEGTRGRYVRIFVEGAERNLSLAEVEVYGTKAPENVVNPYGKNIALNKDARGSTHNHNGAESFKAVDGNIDGKWNEAQPTKNSIAFNAGDDPWWEVDLGAVYDISAIRIYNRTDNCCYKEISGFYVMASKGGILENSTSENVITGPISAVKSMYEIQKEGIIARYVRIFLKGKSKRLPLAEVEIFGKPAPESENEKGEALYFNSKGFAQFDSPSNMPLGSSGRTVEFWVKANLANNANQGPSPILELGQYGRENSAFGIFLEKETTGPYLFLRRKAGEKIELMALPDDQWYHIAVVLDNQNIKAYVNGIEKLNKSFSELGGINFNTTKGINYIGGNPGLQQFFSGAVGDISIWNTARNEQQIKDGFIAYPRIKGDEANLVLHFPLNEGIGNSFKNRKGSISGTLKNGASWTQSIDENPTPFAEGIWYVIQNKSDLTQDQDISSQNLALKYDGTSVNMGSIPFYGNYDEFLWRVVKRADGKYQLINKKLGETKALDSSPTAPAIGNKNISASGQKWVLEQANKKRYGTNVVLMSNDVISDEKVIYRDNGKIAVANKNAGDARQLWHFQPMELCPGFHIPKSGIGYEPSSKMLITDSGLKTIGTKSVSDYAMLNMHLMVNNMINALDYPMKDLPLSMVYMISSYDNDAREIVKYPLVKINGEEWVREFAGGQSGNFTLVNEMLTNRLHADGTYREFDHITHEFGHAIHLKCDQNTIVQKSEFPCESFKDDDGNIAPFECYAASVSAWFNSNFGYRNFPRTRVALKQNKSGLYGYMDDVLNEDNSWLPPRNMRTAIPIKFSNSIASGSSFKAGQTLLKGNFIGTQDQRMECKLETNGNLTVRSYNPGNIWVYNAVTDDRIKNYPNNQTTEVEFIDGEIIFKNKDGNEIDRMGIKSSNSKLVLADDSKTPKSVLKVVSDSGEILWESGSGRPE